MLDFGFLLGDTALIFSHLYSLSLYSCNKKHTDSERINFFRRVLQTLTRVVILLDFLASSVKVWNAVTCLVKLHYMKAVMESWHCNFPQGGRPSANPFPIPYFCRVSPLLAPPFLVPGLEWQGFIGECGGQCSGSAASLS